MTWLGEVTTGHGVMVLVPTVLALISGTMSWSTGAPLLLAGVIGLIWPETTRQQAPSQAAVSNAEEIRPGCGAHSTAASAHGQQE